MRLQRLYWSAYARDGRTRSTVFKDGDFLIKAKNKDVATVRRRWSH